MPLIKVQFYLKESASWPFVTVGSSKSRSFNFFKPSIASAALNHQTVWIGQFELGQVVASAHSKFEDSILQKPLNHWQHIANQVVNLDEL